MTHIVKDDIASIQFYWSHAPSQKDTLENEIGWEGILERVQHWIQKQLHHRENSQHDPVLIQETELSVDSDRTSLSEAKAG